MGIAVKRTKPSENRVRKNFVMLWLLVLMSAVGALFWYNDWLYQVPTPVPEAYRPVNTGNVIALDGLLDLQADKPVFLHFYNPDCPCSRFNKTHFKALVRHYGHAVNFAVVVMSRKVYSTQEIQEKFGLDLPVLVDPSVATRCGVYSTPQAVILDAHHRLYYRGNYNRSRYCTDKKTNYAELALTALLRNDFPKAFDLRALTAYGCSLPYCKTDDGL